MDTNKQKSIVDELMQELQDDSDSKEQEKIVAKTSYDIHEVQADQQFYTGTIDITDELHREAKVLVEERFKSCAEYTKQRIARIDRNWELYGSHNAQTDSLTNLFYPDTWNSASDWIDDLTLIFQNFVNYLQITDTSNSVEEFITRKLPVQDTDMKKKNVTMFFNLLRNAFGKQQTTKETMYYFSKKDTLKSFIKWGVEKSEFEYRYEDWVEQGVVTGQFLTKDEYRSRTRDYTVVFNKQDAVGGTTQPEYLEEETPAFLFSPVDPRTVVYPKHKNVRWIAQEIETSIPEMLAEAMDIDGNQKKHSRYDLKRVQKLAEYIRENRGQKASNIEGEDDQISGDVHEHLESAEAKQEYLEAEVKIYEIHWIPLILPGSKKPQKTRMYGVNCGTLESPLFYIVGIEPTPYVADFPYHSTAFIRKSDEWCGKGLPELLETLQSLINQVHNHVTDMMMMGLYGIMIYDPDAIENESSIEKIYPRMAIRMKNARGRRAQDIIQWMHPPLDTINFSEAYLQRIEEMMKRTSRKGPTGERVSPQVTATEMMSIIEELKKSVNRVALRANAHLTKWCERMYLYYMLNWRTPFRFKADAYRLFGIDSDKLEDELKSFDLSQLSEEYRVVNRMIEIEPQELMVNGLNFKCDAVDSFQREAVERQQIMQAVDLFYSKQAITNPQTGEPRIFTDENGTQLVISEYKLLKRVADIMNLSDLFVPASRVAPQPMPPQGPEGQGAGPGGAGVPPLNAGTNTADLINRVQGGVNAQ